MVFTAYHVPLKILTMDEVSIGKISKQWTGLLREVFTDSDNFGIQFPMDLDVRMKAVMIGACFLIVSMSVQRLLFDSMADEWHIWFIFIFFRTSCFLSQITSCYADGVVTSSSVETSEKRRCLSLHIIHLWNPVECLWIWSQQCWRTVILVTVK